MTRPDPDRPRDAPSDSGDGGVSGIVRRLRRRRRTAEDRLCEVIEDHRRELEEQTRRFEETLADLERREQLLSDSRASVERLLRLGTKDLDAREADVAALALELAEREKHLREQEEKLAQRRSELGAVELKRLAVERQERALGARERRVEEDERRLAAAGGEIAAHAGTPVSLAFVPGPRYRLVEVESRRTSRGDTLVVDGKEHLVVRVGPSPFPGDERRCAYLLG